MRRWILLGLEPLGLDKTSNPNSRARKPNPLRLRKESQLSFSDDSNVGTYLKAESRLGILGG